MLNILNIEKLKTKAIDYSTDKLKNYIYYNFGKDILIPMADYSSEKRSQIWQYLYLLNPNIEKQIIGMTKNKSNSKTSLEISSMNIDLNISKMYFITKKKDTGVVIKSGSKALADIINKPTGTNDTSNFLYIYFFGKEAYKFYKEFIYNIGNIDSNRMLLNFSVSGCLNNHNKPDISINTKNIDIRKSSSLFFDDDIIGKIHCHIDQWIRNENKYLSRGLNYKTGILLYGEPGTGKSSLIKSICGDYHYDMVEIDLSTFNTLDTNVLASVISNTDGRQVVVLEDIDCLILDRENKDINKDEKTIINKLLQFLDSNSSPNNVIIIATTNHIELLDEAILRNGRFDLKLEVKSIKKKETALRMIESFELNEKDTKKILSDIQYPINQSYLQGEILKYL